MKNVCPGSGKDRLAFLESGFITTDHITKCLGIRATFTTADFCVDYADTFRFGEFRELVYGLGVNRTMHSDNASRFSAVEDTAFSKSHGFHLRIINNDQLNDV